MGNNGAFFSKIEILKFFISICYFFFFFNRSGYRILAHFKEETCKKSKSWTIEVKKEVEKIFSISKQIIFDGSLTGRVLRTICISLYDVIKLG